MDSLLNNAEKLIREASKSKAAMLALMLILLSAVTLTLFKDASDGAKLTALFLLTLCIAGFASIAFSPEHNDTPKNPPKIYKVGLISISKKSILIVISVAIWITAYLASLIYCIASASEFANQWPNFWFYVNHLAIIPFTTLILCLVRPISPKWSVIYVILLQLGAMILSISQIIYHPNLKWIRLPELLDSIYLPFLIAFITNLIVVGLTSHFFYIKSAIR